MKVAAGVLAFLAIVMALVPCVANCGQVGEDVMLASGERVHPPCYWTARAAMAVAAPLMAVACLLACSWRQETRLMLGALGLVLGALAILLPTLPMSTCPSPGSVCKRVMRPVLMADGAGTIVAGAAVMAAAARRSEYAQRPRRAGHPGARRSGRPVDL